MRRIFLVIAGLAVALTVTLLVAGWLTLRASLPQLDGALRVAGLADAVTLERDALGVVTITAGDRVDAAYATGFAHAQDRFFQMDLQRRAGAGELAALLGPALVDTDRYLRVHRFGARATKLSASLPPPLYRLFAAYADGVNAGLVALGARPYEYVLLGTEPRPWRPEDTLLVMYSMWFELNDETAERDSQLGLLREELPPSVYAWLIQSGTEWDAPLVGGPVPAVPLPPATDYDLRTMPSAWFRRAADARGPARDEVPGSNSFAVAAQRSATGSALLAGDMHLGLRVPNIWYRVRIVIPREHPALDGVTLAGAPLLVAGGNGRVAWAFTNSYGDWQDLVVLETDADMPRRYRTIDGWRDFEVHRERIEVRGGPPVEIEVRETVWGPVIDEDQRGRLRALRWSAHDVEATVADLTLLETATNVDDAIAAANRIGIPPQNMLAADDSGRIGWSIAGRIPVRDGIDPLNPTSWSDGRGWRGYLPPARYPRIVDPGAGVLWTANARTVDGDWLALVGEGNYPPGARARQIRDALIGAGELAPDDLRRIQLDDRALFLARWQRLLLQVLESDARGARSTPQARAILRELVRNWGERAAIDSAGYRMVRAFRERTHAALVTAWLAPVLAAHEGFALTRHDQLERPVWQALTERPAHLLDPRFDSWDEWLTTLVDDLIGEFEAPPGGLAARTWGERNTVRIAHPLAASLPVVGRLLRMPAQPLPGDADMPRVQGVDFGASQRMIIAPGREQAGFFHMPAGQSGHPLSPYFAAGHESWATGTPLPFLPGPAQHRLTLEPAP